MQDRSFKQAMEALAQTFNKQIYLEVQKRLDFLLDGQTVAEATADISDARLRQMVTESLLFVYALSLDTSLYRLDIVNQKQAAELHTYLRARLAPAQTDILSLYL